MFVPAVTSRKNKAVIDAASLADKKARDESGLFSAEGAKLLEEVLDTGLAVETLFYTESAAARYASLIERVPEKALVPVTDEVFAKLSTEKAPQGLYACVKKPSVGGLDNLSRDASQGGFVFLDEVQNPANVGAILRSAYAFGFVRAVFCGACADLWSPKTVRAAMGSLFRERLYEVPRTAEAVSAVKAAGGRVFCTALLPESRKLHETAFLPTDSFLVGNEGHGASDDVIRVCGETLYIPMREGAESLNASVAAAVVMWEMKKQRGDAR